MTYKINFPLQNSTKPVQLGSIPVTHMRFFGYCINFHLHVLFTLDLYNPIKCVGLFMNITYTLILSCKAQLHMSNLAELQSHMLIGSLLRESSFNMTRGDEDIEGGSENLYTSKPTGGWGGLLKN